MTRRRGRPRKNNGGSIATAIRLAPTTIKALLRALAIKTAKRTAIPATAATAGYTAGRRHKKAITIKY